ncbi:MAG: hypothetical protein JSV56_08665, partial [Methanomassiliicoccales archaeon]
MKFSKRVNYMLLLFLFVLNIAFRYPVVQHELGADSLVIHILANSITKYHYAKWILHPLSYIGLYPLSYPSASPFLIAGISSSTGLSTELSIMLFSIGLGMIGVFSTYFLAREIKNDDMFCFVAALAFSLSPIFIRSTFWQASTRNLFVSLAPACILLLLKTRGFAINRLNILFVILLLTVGTSHRLGVFMIFILIAYLVGVLIFAIYKQLVPYMAKSSELRRSSRVIAPLIIMGIFIILLSMLLSGNNPLQGAQGLMVYEQSTVFTGSSPPILILNLFVSLAGRIGTMLVFGLIGLGYLIWKKNKGIYDVFLIVAFIFIFPTIGMRTYSSYFFLVFFSLLAGLAFLNIYTFLKRWKSIVLAILVVTIIASTGFVYYMFDHWNVSTGSIPKKQYDSAMYFKYNTENTFVSNDGLIAARVSAVSEKPCLPIGGATLHTNGPEQLINDYLHEDDFEVIPIPLQQISVGSNALYDAKGARNVEQDWATIHGTDCDEVPRNLILRYNLRYSLSYKGYGNEFSAY